MSKQTNELDQVMNVYREKIKVISHLWLRLVQLGQCDGSLMKTAEEILEQLELSATSLAEEQVDVEMAKQVIRNLKQMIDVSRQTVDAKSKHLGVVEQQQEEEQNFKWKEFQKIHKIEGEKVDIENTLVPLKEKMSTLMEKLSRKCEKSRYLEEFFVALTEHMDLDRIEMKTQAEKARMERSNWDKFDVDVLEEVNRFPLDANHLSGLQTSVMEMKQAFQNQNNWYEEELSTKLHYSSRNREIQNKIDYLKTVVKRMERSGRYDEKENCKGISLSERSESVMVDGLPDIQAKDVEEFLGHQFGVRVLADYSMLRRLKEDIGVVGLAYLVERIRLQGSHQNTGPSAHRTYKDLEERQIETALQTIAMEYRAQEETGRRSCMSSNATDVSEHIQDGLSISTGTPRSLGQRLNTDRFLLPSSSPISTYNGGGMDRQSLNNSDVFTGSGASSRKGSTSSLKSKSSLSRIKKMFKF